MKTWVIFDVSPKQYYQDVHNLLALPRGMHLRYEYRSNWLSAAAIEATENNLDDRDALLAYAQLADYERGTPVPREGIPYDMIWVPTRFARISSIVQRGDTYFFDLELSGYPEINDWFDGIIKSLISKRIAPFEKLVALVEHDEPAVVPTLDEDRENWAKVVDVLGRAPSQYEGDSFWKINEFKALDGEGASQINVEEAEGTATHLVFRERSRLGILIESYTPASVGDTSERSMSINTPDEAPIRVQPTALDLRPHSIHEVKVDVPQLSGLKDANTALSMDSGKSDDGWPLGPKVDFQVRIAKDLVRVILGVLMVVVGMAIIGVGFTLDDIIMQLVAFVVGVGAGTTGNYIATGNFVIWKSKF